jgi:hypothetical protein
MENNEKILRVKSSSVWPGEKNIVFGNFSGKMDENMAIELFFNIAQLGNEMRNSISVCIENSEMESIDLEARRIFQISVYKDKIRKIAIYGNSNSAKTNAEFIISAIRNEKAKFFPNKIRALDWLNN